MAKLTHKIYGISSHPAKFDNLKNFIIVSNIKTHKIKITINPSKGDFKPKKATDQNEFKTS